MISNEVCAEMLRRGFLLNVEQKAVFEKVSAFISGLMTEYDLKVTESFDFENGSGIIEAGFTAFEVLQGDIQRFCDALSEAVSLSITTDKNGEASYLSITIPKVFVLQ